MSSPLGGLKDSLIDAVAADPKGGVLVAGDSFGNDGIFPGGEALTANLDDNDFGFAFRLDLAPVPHGKPSPTSIVNAASYLPRFMVPGAFATLFGSGLGPQTGESFRVTTDSRVPTQLAGVQVTVGGLPAPILYAQDRQINIAVPQSVKDAGDVCVIRGEDRTCIFSQVVPVDAAIFKVGNGYSVFNQDGTLNWAQNPAARGSYITVWGAGFGGYTRSFADGEITDLPLAYLERPVTAGFGDPRNTCPVKFGSCVSFPAMSGEVTFAGAAPFAINGLTQINIKVPDLPVGGASPFSIYNGITQAGAVVYLK